MLFIFLVRLQNGLVHAVPAADKTEAYRIATAGYPSNQRPLLAGPIEEWEVRPPESFLRSFIRARLQAKADTIFKVGVL